MGKKGVEPKGLRRYRLEHQKKSRRSGGVSMARKRRGGSKGMRYHALPMLGAGLTLALMFVNDGSGKGSPLQEAQRGHFQNIPGAIAANAMNAKNYMPLVLIPVSWVAKKFVGNVRITKKVSVF